VPEERGGEASNVHGMACRPDESERRGEEKRREEKRREEKRREEKRREGKRRPKEGKLHRKFSAV